MKDLTIAAKRALNNSLWCCLRFTREGRIDLANILMQPRRRMLDVMWTESILCLSVLTENTFASLSVIWLNRSVSSSFSVTIERKCQRVFGEIYFESSEVFFVQPSTNSNEQ
jgi:hypothetical protein